MPVNLIHGRTSLAARCEWLSFEEPIGKGLSEILKAKAWTFSIHVGEDKPVLILERRNTLADGRVLNTTLYISSRSEYEMAGTRLYAHWSIGSADEHSSDGRLSRGVLATTVVEMVNEMETARKRIIAEARQQAKAA